MLRKLSMTPFFFWRGGSHYAGRSSTIPAPFDVSEIF
jgi:hypothetical protein